MPDTDDMQTPNKYFSRVTSLHLVRTVLISLALTLGPVLAKAEVIFEGYYKVNLEGEHRGYAIQRYEFDGNKKEFTSTYFIYVRISPDGKRFTTESLVAKSNDKFQPLNYQYTAILEGKPLIIDAKFDGRNLRATVKREGKDERKTRVIPEGSFLSTMLLHLILQNGLKVGKGFSYNAIAEEDVEVRSGTARVAAETTYKGIKAFRLEYDFKDIASVAMIAESGHVLFSEAPLQKVSTELVANPNEARGNFSFPEKTLKTLFKGLPEGKKNILAQAQSTRPQAQTQLKSSPVDVTAPKKGQTKEQDGN
jgi:hypothetical protein